MADTKRIDSDSGIPPLLPPSYGKDAVGKTAPAVAGTAGDTMTHAVEGAQAASLKTVRESQDTLPDKPLLPSGEDDSAAKGQVTPEELEALNAANLFVGLNTETENERQALVLGLLDKVEPEIENYRGKLAAGENVSPAPLFGKIAETITGKAFSKEESDALVNLFHARYVGSPKDNDTDVNVAQKVNEFFAPSSYSNVALLEAYLGMVAELRKSQIAQTMQSLEERNYEKAQAKQLSNLTIEEGKLQAEQALKTAITKLVLTATSAGVITFGALAVPKLRDMSPEESVKFGEEWSRHSQTISKTFGDAGEVAAQFITAEYAPLLKGKEAEKEILRDMKERGTAKWIESAQAGSSQAAEQRGSAWKELQRFLSRGSPWNPRG